MHNMIGLTSSTDVGATIISVAVDCACKSVLLLALADLAVLCLRRASAAARHLVWFHAVAGLLLLPALSVLLRGWAVLPPWTSAPSRPSINSSEPGTAGGLAERALLPVGADLAGTVSISGPSRLEISSAPPEAMQANAPVPVAPGTMAIQSSAGKTNRSPWELIVWLWLSGMSVVLLPTAIGMLSLWRLARLSQPVREHSWIELLTRLLACLRFRRSVLLLQTSRRRMPMTWGLLRPKVLLPAEAAEWPDERRRVVLLHELAHVQRWDCLSNLLMQVACAVYWFNPLIWLAARRMVSERERACDDIVLGHGAKPADYAEQVLQIASGLPTERLAMFSGIAMARLSKLEERLLAILDGHRDRRAVTRLAAALSVVLVAVVVFPLAMLRAKAQGAVSAPDLSALQSLATPAVAAPVKDAAAVKLHQAEEKLQRVTKLYHDRLLSEVEFNRAKHAVELLKAELSGDKAEIARVKLRQAGEEFNRVSKLYDEKVVSDDEYVEAKNRIEVLKAELALDQGTLAQVLLRQAQEEFDRVAKLYEQNHASEREYNQAKRALDLLKAGPAAPTRHFVRLAVGLDSMTFEGQKTTWDELPELLRKVPNRASTVLELAIDSDNLTIAQLNNARARAGALSHQAGFEYLSYIGVHPVGSKGSPATPRPVPRSPAAPPLN